MIERQYCHQLGVWTNVVSIISIVLGIVLGFYGAFRFILIGSIPGIFMAVLGFNLRNAKKYTDELYALPQGKEKDSDQVMKLLFIHLINHFKFVGVIMLICITLLLLFIVMVVLSEVFGGGFSGILGDFKLF